MKIFTRSKAHTPTVGERYGEPILRAIEHIRNNAKDDYERLNGPTMYDKMTDELLGIDGLVNDLKATYDKWIMIKREDMKND